jgi:N-acetylglutamate synthase-like GNAT family acetyltransferase
MSRQGTAPSFLIRKAHIEESATIASILQQAFIEYETLYTPAAFAATTPASDQIQERWGEGPVWVAVKNMDLLGTVAALPKSNSLYFRSMAVLPHWREQGIAYQLLKVIESYAAANHHNRLFLSTTPFLHSAICLYKRFGFQQSDEEPHDLFGTPLFTMEKRL